MADAEFPPDRWFRFVAEVDDGGRTVTALAHPALVEGRVVVTHLLLVADHVDSVAVSRFPIGALEAGMNTTEIRATLEAGSQAWPDFSQAVDKALAEIGSPTRRPREPREPLRRPSGTDPERFYAQVALAYEEAVLAGQPVAAALAGEAGVPLATAYRWIAEARRRGHIPPARRVKR